MLCVHFHDLTLVAPVKGDQFCVTILEEVRQQSEGPLFKKSTE